MSKRNWKPGDVATWMTPQGTVVVAIRDRRGEWHGVDERGEWYTERPWDSKPLPPLAVIDPEDREQVDRLVSLQTAAEVGDGMSFTDALQAALREFANPTPPKPEEPTGLGAVVEDAEGTRWVRVWGPGIGQPWQGCPGDDEPDVHRYWAKVAAVRVLSEGVAE